MIACFFLLFTLWPRGPFIKNLNLPSCVNCVHFIQYKGGEQPDLGRCSQFGKKDIISGEITYDYASVCRFDKEKCGQTGKYYVEVDHKTPTPTKSD
jgi:hypothetical protein